MSILVRDNGDIQRKEEIRQNCCHQEFRIHWHFSRNKLQQYYLRLLRYGSNLRVDQWTKGLRSCEIYIYIYIHIYIYIYRTHNGISQIYVCVCIYTHTTHTMEYYSVIKNVVSAAWMDLEGLMLSETNQTEKNK